MDTLGPRIMVNVGTQAAATAALNPRDLAPLTNDAFLATFLGKTSLSTNNTIPRQHNSHRQSYTSQMERLSLRSKPRTPASTGDSIEPDSAILSIIRGNHTDNQTQPNTHRSSYGTRNRRRSFNQQLLSGVNDIPCSPNYRPAAHDANRRRRTRSGGAQQQITVVDQMAAQPHIPYAILPKRFEPKQVQGAHAQHSSRTPNYASTSNVNNRNRRRQRRSENATTGPRRGPRSHEYYEDQWEDEEDLWLEPMPPMMHRQYGRRVPRNLPPMNGYYGPRSMPRMEDYYGPYGYGPLPRPTQGGLRSRRRMMYDDEGYMPFDIVPSYDLNEWQGPYARSKKAMQSHGGSRGFIRDDHRGHGHPGHSRYGHKSMTPTRYGKQSKSPKSKGNQPSKRRTSRTRKVRNQNSKSEALGTPSTNPHEPKTTSSESETVEDVKIKTETKLFSEEALPPRDESNKENHEEKKSE